ncbi:putative glycosyl hydrolase [Candidatus Entotheonellaceae bacterium PAL068K]
MHYPGTYLAGCYNRLISEIDGHVIKNEDLVNLPNWLPLTFRIGDGHWFHLRDVDILSYRQQLDLQRGVLLQAVRFRDRAARETTLASRRLVHMLDPHMAAIEMTLTAENWSGTIEVKSALNGRVGNTGVARYRALNSQHLEPLDIYQVTPDTIALKVRTNQSHVDIAQAARTRLFQGHEQLTPDGRLFHNHGYIAQLLRCEITVHEMVTIEKVVSMYDSRDQAISECCLESHTAVARAGRFGQLLRTHERAWEHLWRRFDIDFKASEPAQEAQNLLILRLHTFHLLQVASPHIIERDVSVPARGLHGEAYRGHIFWDELFIFPFLNLRLPEISRALLKYRFRRLPQARAAAQAAGYRGAMFPWQSGSNGREESQVLHLNPKSGRWIPDNTHLQRHINAAIAYNVWQYYQATRDMEFLSYFGAELILEIARFWASMVHYNDALERYEILGVVGPDEYHTAYPDAKEPGLNNNAYTNIMAVWVLCRALDVLDMLPEDRCSELREKLEFTESESERWDDISRKMRVVFHDNGILSQFEGYDKLKEFDWAGYGQTYSDIQRLDRILEAEGDTPNRYKCSKQADVLMLFYLFSSDELRVLFERLDYPFAYQTIPKNIDYYMARTSHGSTLSSVIHSWVLIRVDRQRSWQLLTQALKSDIADVQGGTTPEGIHLGAMAGTVDALQRGYTGIEIRSEVLYLNPRLPQELTKLHLVIRYCGHSLTLDITQDDMRVSASPSAAGAITISVNDTLHRLNAAEVKVFKRDGALVPHHGGELSP